MYETSIKVIITETVRIIFKNINEFGMVAHTCNPSTWEAEAVGSQV
jgi:hypothetical protein